jgi:hypothetical protein
MGNLQQGSQAPYFIASMGMLSFIGSGIFAGIFISSKSAAARFVYSVMISTMCMKLNDY